MRKGLYKTILTGAALLLDTAAGAVVVDTEVDAPATLIGDEPVCSVKLGMVTHCTLRAAIQVANFNGGSTVIELERGKTYTLSASRNGDPADGHAGALTIGPGSFGAVFVTLRAVGGGGAPATITKNEAFDDSLFHVLGQGGVLKLYGVEVRGNAAAPEVAEGGAVRCDHGGNVFAFDTAFVANSAATGGALFLDDCGASLERTGFAANSSRVGGGALAIRDGFAVATDVSFDGNASPIGSAIDVHAQGTQFGFVAVNATFRGNDAELSAIHAQQAAVVLHSVTSIGQLSPTFVDQDGGVLQLANTALTDGGGADSVRLRAAALLQSLGHNRLQQVTATPDASVVFLGTDLLRFGDARVSVHAATSWPGIVAIPLAGSPLIGQGGGEVTGSDGSITPLCTDLDANLVDRTAMQRCDIGAANFVDPVLTSSFDIAPGNAELRARSVRRSRPLR